MKIGAYAVFLLAVTTAPVNVARLELDHEPFLADFRAADGRVRFVTLLSPT